LNGYAIVLPFEYVIKLSTLIVYRIAKTEYMFTIISTSYIFLLLIVGIMGVIRYQWLSLPFKILTWSSFMACILSILSKVWNARYGNNMPILQLECITEVVFYSVVYYYLFKNKVIRKVIIVTIIVFSVSFVINAIFFQPFFKLFPTNIDLSKQILFAIFSLLLFNEMLLYPLKINVIKQSVFWFNTAMLFYATTMFFNLGLSNYLGRYIQYNDIIIYCWYLIIGLFHVLICIALLTENKKITLSYAG
jgi:hypothetical protein